MAVPCLALAASPTFAQDLPPCEVHVFGGANITHPAIQRDLLSPAPIEDPELSRLEEIANGFLLHPTARAARLDKSLFEALVPQGRNYEVIIHGEVEDEKAFKARRERLFESDSDCYGDLMLSNLYAVFPNARQAEERLGALGFLVGTNRVHMTFRYNFFEADSRPVRLKGSVDVPMEIEVVDQRPPTGQHVATELTRVTNAAFALFLERKSRQLPSRQN